MRIETSNGLTGPQLRALRRVCRRLLDELEMNEHEVVLIPAPEPQHADHKIRIAQSRNAKWYRKFSAEYQSARGRGNKRMKRARTYLVRSQVAACLRRMIAGNTSGIYAQRLIRFIERERNNRHYKRRPNSVEATAEFREFGF